MSFVQSSLPFGSNITSNNAFQTSTPFIKSTTQLDKSFFNSTLPTGAGSNFFCHTQNNSNNEKGLFSLNTPVIGQQAITSSFLGFGNPTSTSFFGQEQQAFGAFGQNTNSKREVVPVGTVIKYSPVTGTESIQKCGISQSVNTKLHCITVMKEYEAKSLEELRWDDYQCNRKAQGKHFSCNTSVPTSSHFFNQRDFKSGFGQPVGTGQTNQSVFENNIFATPSTLSSFAFNLNTPLGGSGSNKPFGLSFNNPFQSAGQTTQSAIQPTVHPTALKNNVFGFGQSNVLQTNKLLNKPTAQPSFGVLHPAQQTTTQSGCFQASSSLTANPISFGKAAPTSFSNIFGQNPSNVLQNPLQPISNPPFQIKHPVDTQVHTNSSIAAFGGNKYSSGFSAKSNYTPLSFGNPLIGSQNGPTLLPSSETIDLKAPPDLHTLVGNLYETFPHREIFENIDGNKYINSNSINFSSPEKAAVRNITTKKEPTTNILKTNLFIESKASSHFDPNKLVLLEGTVNETTLQNNNLMMPNTNAKRLILSNKNLKDNKDTKENNEVDEESDEQLHLIQSINQELVLNKNDHKALKLPVSSPLSVIKQNLHEHRDTSPQEFTSNEQSKLIVICEQTDQIKIKKNVSLFTSTDKKIHNNKLLESDSQSFGESNMKIENQSTKNNVACNLINNNENEIPDLCGIKLKRSEYYTIPALNEIHKFKNEKGQCLVKGFTIGRLGYGKVYFPEEIDVSNLDLDTIVEFSYREVTVYPDDSQKPPVGEGLNRPAEITLEHVWPRNRITHEIIKDPKEIHKEDFITRLNLLAEKQNAKLVNYFADTGEWIFSVEHFTKFFFDEDIDKIIAIELNKGRCEEELKENYINVEPEITTTENIISSTLLIPSRKIDNERITLLKSVLFKDDSTSDDVCNKDDESMISPKLSDGLVKVTKKSFIQPKYYSLFNKDCIIPIQNSLLISHTNCMDMELFKGKSFKIGWGPKCSFFILNTKSSFNSHKQYTISTMEIKHLSSKSHHMMNLKQHLKVIFDKSTIAVDKFETPLFTIQENYESLIQHRNIADCMNNDNIKTVPYYAEIWNLCFALWGPNATSPTSRRELFSKWLEECAASYVNNELNVCAIINIFTYLTGHNIEKAAELAMTNEFPQLSLLISQAGTNENFKLLMNHQLKQWHTSGTLNMINTEIIKIYCILSGIDNVSGTINVYDELGWKRTLAMHLWYATSIGTSFINAIQAYNKNMKSLSYTNLPIPDHSENISEMTYDILYHIMNLFINPTLVLEKVINPNNYTDDRLDYRLSWLLLQTFIALKVGSVSEEVANATHISFASQLENIGLWKWSIFVLLFIKDKSAKKETVLGVLSRNFKQHYMNDLGTENFLVNDLKIPREWIHSALIVKSDLLKENAQNYKHYIFISDWCKAHEIAMNSIVPEFVLMGQYEKLLDVLKNLIPGKKNIALWQTQVGLILDILELRRDIYKMENVSSKQLLILKENVIELCCRVKHFPLMTLKHSFTISKLSKFITTLLKILYCELPQIVLETVPEFAHLIKILHMPPDYKYNELMECVYHHVREEEFM